jgi:flagellar export protein FliJ
MRFRFRLARILAFVELREREKKMQVATQAHKVEALAEKKRKLAAQVLAVLAEPLTTIDWLRLRNEKVDLDRQELKRVSAEWVQENEMLDNLHYDLGKIAMRRKAIETLRERKEQEFKLVDNRREQTKLDEAYRMSKLRHK